MSTRLPHRTTVLKLPMADTALADAVGHTGLARGGAKARRRAGARLAAATQPTSSRARATRLSTTAPQRARAIAAHRMWGKRRMHDRRPWAVPIVTGGAARESWVDSRSRAGHP